MTADRIEIRGLRLVAVVGVLPEERTRAQPLEVDLDLVTDLHTAEVSDALGDTVDYGAACDAVAEVAAASEPQLLEQLAGQIAGAILALDERIDSVTVAVRKLRPPLAHDVASTGVRVSRGRER